MWYSPITVPSGISIDPIFWLLPRVEIYVAVAAMSSPIMAKMEPMYCDASHYYMLRTHYVVPLYIY